MISPVLLYRPEDHKTKPYAQNSREPALSLRGGADDEAIPAEDNDCFAPLAMTP